MFADALTYIYTCMLACLPANLPTCPPTPAPAPLDLRQLRKGSTCRAASILQGCDGLLVLVGAGMGVDSGLSTFRAQEPDVMGGDADVMPCAFTFGPHLVPTGFQFYMKDEMKPGH